MSNNTRGFSLGQDLSVLINNPTFSDIEIVCKDKKKLHAFRPILAARSNVFNCMFYNGMRESHEKSISFSHINSSEMKVMMEFMYTGAVKDEPLTKENIVEAFIVADYFQLPCLQDFIVKDVGKKFLEGNCEDNYSPDLLSKLVDMLPSIEENTLCNMLVDIVSAIPLNDIEFGRLSTKALHVLLSYVYGNDKPFATSEYEVFRYSAILVARQISNNATESLLKRLPTLEYIENFTQIDNELIPDHDKVAKELEPLIRLIDFGQIQSKVLTNIIEPLNLIPLETIFNVRAVLKDNTNNIDYVWDELACGSKLIVDNDNKVIRATKELSGHQSVRAKVALEHKGIFKWDIIVERHCEWAWIGVCISEGFDYERLAGSQCAGWTFGSLGMIYNSDTTKCYGVPIYLKGKCRIVVHLDMDNNKCSFTINRVKYMVSEWCELPSKLYPVVSLSYPGQFRIQNH